MEACEKECEECEECETAKMHKCTNAQWSARHCGLGCEKECENAHAHDAFFCGMLRTRVDCCRAPHPELVLWVLGVALW